MNLLFFTDTHIRGNTPKNRKDIFVDTLEKKLIEINDIIKKNKIDFVLHGGDLFDRPDVSISIASKFAMILDKIQVPFYLISGNHDIYGHNPDTVNRTMLGLLDALGVINLIRSNEKIILEKDNVKVQLTGQPYVYDIDSLDKRDYYILKDVKDDVNFSIHMVHGMLLDKPFIKGIPYTLIDDIKDTLADITLCGHYHSGFKTSKINNKYFINPGSLVRVTNSLREIERIPKVVIIELKEDIIIREVPLQTAFPGANVLDRQEIEKNLFKNERITEFKQTIDAALDFEKMDINEVLIEVSTAEDVEEDVKIEALKRIALIQMKGLNGD
ncbi:metallophosphoesterase family protein [Tissierella pigra]|uniref:Metallophosphoesterase n=1 Tax=Tissierella pigra TaxID=2607614 RepID=A0A6N7XU02_9FIRM|nr:metallophosphoesterase [Tissierella pigra]MBU5426590.1 metallophosphoesterase family protein [Tissierella pigra]MST99964.1 metallophosphoesterase [Tissierella pigra]